MKGRLAIVADGMGGYEGGQEASRIAVEVIEEVYANAVDGDPRSWLLRAFRPRTRASRNTPPNIPISMAWEPLALPWPCSTTSFILRT